VSADAKRAARRCASAAPARMPNAGVRGLGLVADIHGRAFWMKQRLLWRERTLQCVSALVKTHGVVVDVGAHRGLYTTWFARRVGVAGEVHAFEPNPMFHRRLAAIGAYLPQVTLHPTALSSREAQTDLYVPRLAERQVPALGRLALEGGFRGVSHDSIEVKTERLDDVSFLRPPSFLKIDVEGHELKVLRGGERLLRDVSPSILVEVEQRHRDGDVREVFGFLAGLGYTGWFVRDNTLQPIDSFDLQRDQLRLVSSDPIEVMTTAYVCDFVFSTAPK
jgi:FkbM family methyltransferase